MLLAVDDDERSRCAVARELRNRYEPDYEVISMGSAEAGLELLTRLADAGREVILVLADQCMPRMTGTEFLTRAAALPADAFLPRSPARAQARRTVARIHVDLDACYLDRSTRGMTVSN